MFKKLIITAAAAAAVSVPLAGVAWADQPTDPGGNGSDNGLGAGGMPKKVGEVADVFGTNLSPGDPLVPGAVFSPLAKEKEPGTITPDAYGDALDELVAPQLGLPHVGSTPPGLGIKSGTAGCANGKTVGGYKLCP